MLSSIKPVPPPSLSPRLSVVVPLHNEEGAIDDFSADISAALSAWSCELLLVDGGSTDTSWARCLALSARDAWIMVLGHARSGGRSAALHSGVLAARAAIMATLEGDGQNPAKNLPSLIAPLLGPDASPTCGLVAGQRVGRQDRLSKRLASRFANKLRSAVLRDGTRDIVQWIASEREKRLVIPIAFWYTSMAGGLVLFTYALWRWDPVFIVGQSMGLVIYFRNLWLIHAEHQHRPGGAGN